MHDLKSNFSIPSFDISNTKSQIGFIQIPQKNTYLFETVLTKLSSKIAIFYFMKTLTSIPHTESDFGSCFANETIF